VRIGPRFERAAGRLGPVVQHNRLGQTDGRF
jgi:hypothetical protein